MNKSVKLILSSLILGLSLSSVNADEPTTTATTIIPTIIEAPVDASTPLTNQTVNGFWGIAKDACAGFLVGSNPIVKTAITKTFNFIKTHPKEMAIVGIFGLAVLSNKIYSWYKNKQTAKKQEKIHQEYLTKPLPEYDAKAPQPFDGAY